MSPYGRSEWVAARVVFLAAAASDGVVFALAAHQPIVVIHGLALLVMTVVAWMLVDMTTDAE